MTHSHHDDELLKGLTQQTLSVDETLELRSRLKASPELLDKYLDFCDLDEHLAMLSDRKVVRLAARNDIGERSKGNWRVGVIAVSLLIGVGLYFWRASNEIRDTQQVAMQTNNEQPANNQAKPGRNPGANPRNESPKSRNDWKIINSVGSVKHPAAVDAVVPNLTSAANRPIKFNRDIRPILSETCFHCHGPDEEGRRADLRLDTFKGATEDIGGYSPVVPGNLDDSEAWTRIISDDPDLLMPPPESHLMLTEDQKLLIRRWIQDGAEYESHWAFIAPRLPEVPAIDFASDDENGWGHNEIDSFVAEKLAESGLSPSGEADPRTLIRRLSFDLTGLPPKLSDVVQFDREYRTQGESAYQALIMRLLQSDHFGERMAVPWLDQARYADTNGYSIDGGRQMWMWRDWVINAYNENQPFDQFVTHQLAGDLLTDATDANRIATGFNRNHMVTHEGGTIPEENLTNYAADRVKTTCEVFLGLTVGCAQCHDHKYDPISQREYYQFFAFFNELDDRGLDGNAGRNPTPQILARTVLSTDEQDEIEMELADLQKRYSEITDGFDEWLAEAESQETARAEGFMPHHVKMLDVSSPNRPGAYEVKNDGSVLIPVPGAGLNAFSHSMRLPKSTVVHGIRIRFYPYSKETSNEENEEDSDRAVPSRPRLTSHQDGVPKVTAVLASANNQPAQQVDIHNQLAFSKATASSFVEGFSPQGVLDERNLHWWKPNDSFIRQHLTVTFDKPVNSDDDPFLSVMVFFGVSKSLPHHWKIEAFTGNDTDSIFSPPVANAIATSMGERTQEQIEVLLAEFRRRSPTLKPLRIRMANLRERLDVLTKPQPTMVMNIAKNPVRRLYLRVVNMTPD